MRYSRIVATGHYLPERVLTNDELERMVETSDAWIRARTGIRQRHIAAPTESVAGMGERASRMALETCAEAHERVMTPGRAGAVLLEMS